MGYLIDRQHVLFMEEIIAVVHARQRQRRGLLVLRDNSLYQTRTRPRTLIRRGNGPGAVGWRCTSRANIFPVWIRAADQETPGRRG
jgi:hypothetical protein